MRSELATIWHKTNISFVKSQGVARSGDLAETEYQPNYQSHR